MNCSEVEHQLDDYLDGHRLGDEALSGERVAGIALHVEDCPRCAAELSRRRAMLDDLRSLPVPGPDEDLLDRMVLHASAAAGSRSEPPAHRRRRTDASRPNTPVLTALVAAFVAALLLGTLVLTPGQKGAPDKGLPGISLTTDTVTPVKLAFSSETALEDARLSITLPVGVELVGYDGRSEISWYTDLEAGTNMLRLPLVGRMAADDLLIARLSHPTGTKTFRLHVTVTESGANHHE
jgi:hypothetical protein